MDNTSQINFKLDDDVKREMTEIRVKQIPRESQSYFITQAIIERIERLEREKE